VQSKFALRVVVSVALVIGLMSSVSLATAEYEIEPGLEKVSVSGLDSLYVRPGTDFDRYARIKIESLKVSFDERRRIGLSDYREGDFTFDEIELETFNKRFTAAVSEVWLKRQGWQLTEEVGEDVLILRTSIEDLYLFVSIKERRSVRQDSMARETSRMTIHARLIDAATGQTVLVSTDRRITGERSAGSSSLRRVTPGRYWQDAYTNFHQWAVQLARSFAEAE
jgi:hypothetical protein